MKQFVWISTSLLFLGIIGCTRSLVYSPSAHLPAEPSLKNDIQLYGGLSMLVETRPHRVNREISGGVDGLIRFGITDRIGIHMKGWQALEKLENKERRGYALGMLIRLGNSSNKWDWGISSQGGVATYGSDIEGTGISLSGVFWAPKVTIIRPYLAFGPIWGRRNSNSDNPDKFEKGWGIITNIGVNTTFSKLFVINGEISAIKQNNQYDSYSRFIISPSIGLSCNF